MIAIAIIWIAIVICIPIMRKVEPGAWKAYAVYAILVGIIFTVFQLCL